jgi:hydroxyacylglutathione hydrolase
VSGPAFRLKRVVSSGFEEITYVAALDGHSDCIVIDPGLEPEKIVAYLEGNSLTPTAILLTHGHGDHIGGNAAMKHRWPDCPLVCGTAEASMLLDPVANLSATFGLGLVSPPADRTVEHGEAISYAGFDLEVRAVPGHSPGHVVYVWRGHDPGMVFVGDVIFAGSVGRTDFPGGSFQQLARGIREQIYTLPDDTILLPGHGPKTTVGDEKRCNGFVREI